MYRIEFFGLPGVGKTTIKNLLAKRRVHGNLSLIPQEYACQWMYLNGASKFRMNMEHFISTLSMGKFESYLRYKSLSYAKSRLMRGSAYEEVALCGDKYIEAAFSGSRKGTALRAIEFFSNTMTDYLSSLEFESTISSNSKYSGVYIFDEGFSQRALTLKEADVGNEAISEYLSSAPKADIIFYCKLEKEERRKRLEIRKLKTERNRFSKNCYDDYLTEVKPVLAMLSDKVVDIEMDGPADNVFRLVLKQLNLHFQQHTNK